MKHTKSPIKVQPAASLQQQHQQIQPNSLQDLQQIYELQPQHAVKEGTFTAALRPLGQHSAGCKPGTSYAAATAGALKGNDHTVTEAEDEAAASLKPLLTNRAWKHVWQHLPAGKHPCLVQLQADSGCTLQARMSDGSTVELPVELDMHEALKRLATAKGLPGSIDLDKLFGGDNRAGVPGTLHRIAAMRGKQGEVLGLTYRVGRHVPGVGMLLADLLGSMKRSIRDGGAERPQSLLLLGKPGVGKTTLLRDVARLMSLPPSQGGLGLAVLVVDTSNEIAGDCEQPHTCIGHARRMMVPSKQQQAQVLLEAVANHAPDVVIIDEIGTREEVAAARTINERGVLVVGTAHSSSLSSLLCNSELSALVGGATSVTLGDELAQASRGDWKARLERAGAATFVSLVEMHEKDRMRVHLNVERSVDDMLAAARQQQQHSSGAYSGSGLGPDWPASLCDAVQLRSRCASSGRLLVQFETAAAASTPAARCSSRKQSSKLKRQCTQQGRGQQAAALAAGPAAKRRKQQGQQQPQQRQQQKQEQPQMQVAKTKGRTIKIIIRKKK